MEVAVTGDQEKQHTLDEKNAKLASKESTKVALLVNE